jgi:hypothetical protein
MDNFLEKPERPDFQEEKLDFIAKLNSYNDDLKGCSAQIQSKIDNINAKTQSFQKKEKENKDIQLVKTIIPFIHEATSNYTKSTSAIASLLASQE